MTPNQINTLYRYNLDEIESKIDEDVKKNHGMYPWEDAILDREYETEIRDELAKRYINAGWNYVYHHTSSENGERPGLTCFILSMDPVKHIEDGKKYHKFKRVLGDNNTYVSEKYGTPKKSES